MSGLTFINNINQKKNTLKKKNGPNYLVSWNGDCNANKGKNHGKVIQ